MADSAPSENGPFPNNMPKPRDERASAPTDKPLILVVEDDPDVALLTKDALERDGRCRAETVVSGEQALDRLAKERADLVLVDYRLPGMDGLQLLASVRSEGSTVPVVMVTGQGSEEVAARSLSLGASEYIIKQGNYFSHLPTVVERVLSRWRLEQEVHQRNQELVAMLEMAGLVANGLQLDALLTTVARRMLLLTGVSHSFLALKDAGGAIRVVWADGRKPVGQPGLGPSDPLAGCPHSCLVWQTGKPRVLHSPGDMAHPAQERETMQRWGAKSHLALPLTGCGQLLGVMGLVETRQPRAFAARELELWQGLASQAALAIHNALLYDQARQRLAEVTLLNQKLETFSNLVHNAVDGIAICDLEGNLIYANEALGRLVGREATALVGGSLSSLFSSKPGQPMTFGPLAQAGYEGWSGELEALGPDRRPIPVLVSVSPLREPGGAPHSVALLVRDLTERKKIEGELLRVEKLHALGMMASGVAHDFNNVLAAILGRSELLLLNLDRTGRRDLEESLEVIRQAAQDGAATVRRLRGFTRMHDEPLPEALEVNIDQTVREAIELTRHRWEGDAQRRGVAYQIRTELAGPSPVAGSPSELREVLVNLLLNAIDAMPRGGGISVGSAARGDQALIWVRDEGAGMSQEVKARIFDPFFTTKGPTGSGLGLSVVYGIVARHRGQITVESEEGQGSMFTLRLPLADKLPQGPAAPAVKPGKSRRILVIDDEPEVGRVLTALLRTLGHHVTLRQAGGEGLAAFRSALSDSAGPFDLVFTDLVMPGVNGWEVAAEVQRLRPGTPVVLVTGWSDELRGERLQDRGVSLALAKPFQLSDVSRLLSQAEALLPQARG